MEYSINTFYKNHSHIYKILLFIATTFLIVFMFPKSGRFKYNFEKGKPWQTENLYAPFDFAIQKKPADLAKEKELLKQQSSAYFNRDKTVKNDVIKNFNSVFDKTFNDTLQFKTELKNQALSIISKFYEYGIINENLKFSNNKKIVILEDNQEVEATEFKNLYNQTEVKSTIENTLTNVFSNSSKNALIAVFFNVIKPNLTYDKTLTENVLNESLQTVSINRGVVEKETLIISKGEIVNDNKFQILNSLSKEYESKDWTKSNYYWIVFAYTLLVALALLMLLLFIRKYRLDVYNNNTKVTFIFFNVLVVVLLTTLIINYKSEYVYIVPIAILPLVLKAFFDARLGLFTHVITVLLLGSIVPNSYEYMFLQIIAGIVTILTVSELYKRANLFISVGQITLIYIIAYFAFFVIHEASIENIHKQTFVLFILCGLATLFVQPLIYIYEKLFGLVSDVSLLELSDTNSRLLKELSNKAPGTFHHSLNV